MDRYLGLAPVYTPIGPGRDLMHIRGGRKGPSTPLSRRHEASWFTHSIDTRNRGTVLWALPLALAARGTRAYRAIGGSGEPWQPLGS